VMKELDGLKTSSRIANEDSSEGISNQSVGHLARPTTGYILLWLRIVPLYEDRNYDKD